MLSGLPYGFLFVFMMVFGTVFSLSSPHWLGVWAGLEFNLIGFLPLLVYNKKHVESESTVKYFIVQSLGSALLIFGSLLCGPVLTWEALATAPLISFMVILSGLIAKIGMFPFHFWLPSVMAGLSWPSCMLLATWQKVGPLFLLMSILEINSISFLLTALCFLASASALVGGIGGLNQTQVRALLGYSSIGHLGWMIFAASQSTWVTKNYLLIYLLISLFLFMSLWYLNLENNKTGSNLSSTHPVYNKSVMLLLLSLGGLPPLLGFAPKWMVMLSSMSDFMSGFLCFLILGSVISLFYYLALVFSVSLNNDMYINDQHRAPSMFLNMNLAFNFLGGCLLFFII